MSSVTMPGSRAWTRLSASSPLRAVPTTLNSPDAATICEIRRRMNALSSTTSTDGLEDTIASLDRSHFDAAVVEVQEDTAPVVGADVFGHDRYAGRLQSLARRRHVAVADGLHVP